LQDEVQALAAPFYLQHEQQFLGFEISKVVPPGGPRNKNSITDTATAPQEQPIASTDAIPMTSSEKKAGAVSHNSGNNDNNNNSVNIMIETSSIN